MFRLFHHLYRDLLLSEKNKKVKKSGDTKYKIRTNDTILALLVKPGYPYN